MSSCQHHKQCCPLPTALTVTSQAFDYEHSGFAHLLYWVEVERMALQAVGGQVGNAAVAAACSILDSAPRSVVLARCGLHRLRHTAWQAGYAGLRVTQG